MSIKVIAAVIERYPRDGGEYTLALMLAWHASDDGGRIFPSVRKLAAESRQSVRTVQYQLKRMQDAGWLRLVGNAHGGAGRTREYRIDPAWLANNEKRVEGRRDPVTCNHAPAVEQDSEEGMNRLQTCAQWLDECRAAGGEAIPKDDPVFDYAKRVGMPQELLVLHWRVFLRRGREQTKRARDWPAKFRRSVESNAFGLWICRGEGDFVLSTVGQQERSNQAATAESGARAAVETA